MRDLHNNWKNIDNWSLSLEQLQTCVTFICHNYEIEFEGELEDVRWGHILYLITIDKIEATAL